MSRRRRWIRVPPERKHAVASLFVSGAVAAGVGLVTYYVTRTLLAREPLEGPPGTQVAASDRPGPRGA